MKRLIFDELLLTSLKEKAARRVRFHPEMTIVKGGNDTGKSSLLKSLYRCFGATSKVNGKWLAADVKGLLRFTVDGVRYSLLQDGDCYTLFDAQDSVIRQCRSVTNDLAPIMSDLLDFKLLLVSRQMDLITPPPAYLFLPYYVDQDSSWQKNWMAFENLQQLSNWRRDVVEYHVGIKPNEYYIDKGSLAQLQDRIKEPKDRCAALDAILKDLKHRLQKVDFSYDIDAYAEQVKELLVECDGLSKKEEKLKDKLVGLYTRKTSLEAQIEIAKRAISEVGKDYKYASESIVTDAVECPICGASYDNSFAERFEFARDEDRCHELCSELVVELFDLKSDIAQIKTEYDNVQNELVRINAILNYKQGEIKLRDVIESEGRKQVRVIIQNDIAQVKALIWGLESEIEALRQKLRTYDDSDRKKHIVEDYQRSMQSFLHDLNVENLSPKSYAQVDTTIKETGSDLPRALLAYYFSILNIINRYGSSAFCPMVIDAPHQQDQDIPNSIQMLEFVKSNRPQNAQVILGVVNTFGVEFPGTTITLTAKDHLLDEDCYEEVMLDVRPMLDKSMQAGLSASHELQLTSV